MWHQRKLTKKRGLLNTQNNARNKKWGAWCVLASMIFVCFVWQSLEWGFVFAVTSKKKKMSYFSRGADCFCALLLTLFVTFLFIVGRTSCDACEPHVGPCWTSRASPKPKKRRKNRLSIERIQLKINIGTWKRRMRRTSSWKARSTFILNLAEHSR